MSRFPQVDFQVNWRWVYLSRVLFLHFLSQPGCTGLEHSFLVHQTKVTKKIPQLVRPQLTMPLPFRCRPFFLNPAQDAPKQGEEKLAVYNRKFGAQRIAQMLPRMTQVNSLPRMTQVNSLRPTT
jgi:hypothetical protein